MKPSMIRMSFMRLIYSIFKSFILIFVNIYLWQSGKSIQTVAVFNIFNYLAATGSFGLANVIALKNSRYNYILSSLSFIIAFAMTAVLGVEIARYAVLIGILGGCGDGFFLFNLNTFQVDELDKEELDQFMSIIGGLNKISAIVTPLISGLIIESFGFISMVNFLLVLLVVQLVMSFTMPSSQIDVLGRIQFLKMFSKSEYAKVLWTNTVKAPYKQFTIMVNSVFLYSLVASESLIGFLNSGFSVISILLFVLYRRVLRRITRRRAMFHGAVASSVVFFLMIKPSLMTFILFGVLVSYGTAFFSTPMVSVQINAAKTYAVDRREVLGNLMHRNIMLNTGRIIFFILVYYFYEDFTSPIFLLFLVYNLISSPLTYWLAKNEIWEVPCQKTS
jgi:hypothetical protein